MHILESITKQQKEVAADIIGVHLKGHQTVKITLA